MSLPTLQPLPPLGTAPSLSLSPSIWTEPRSRATSLVTLSPSPPAPLSNAIGPLFTASSSCPLHLHLTGRNETIGERAPRNLRFHRVKNRKLMHGYWRDKSRNLIQVPSRAVHGRRRPPLPLSLSRYRRRQWRRPSFDAWPKPPQRWDKELVWIYCERCTAEQAMDAKSWKPSGDDSNSKLLDAASGEKKRSRNKNKRGWLVLHPINPAKSLFHRAVAILAPLLFIGIGPRDSPIFVSKLFLLETRGWNRTNRGDREISLGRDTLCIVIN